MKFSRSAAVIGAATVLVGGAAVAVNAATSTDTVQLCVNRSTTSVSAPTRSGDCVSGELVTLPSKAAYDALKAQVAGQTSTIAGLQTEVDFLSSRLNELDPGRLTAATLKAGESTVLKVGGVHLLAGAPVHMLSSIGGSDLGPVADDGTFDYGHTISCSILPVTVSTTTAWGHPVEATVQDC